MLVHAIVALGVRRPFENPPSEVEVVSIQHRMLALRKLTTPPPRPHATPVPHPAPTNHAPAKPHGTQAAGGAGNNARANAAPTAAPSAAPTASAGGCAKADLSAAVVTTPPQPDIPVAARASGTSGIALIKVQLDAQGTVTGASVDQSSGNASLDVIAVSMALGAQYSPALHDCKPVASAYTFSVKFVPW